MDNIRLILIVLLSFSCLMLWEAWQRDYQSDSVVEEPTPSHEIDVPTLPTTPPLASAPVVDSGVSTIPQTKNPESTAIAEHIKVVTDVIEIDLPLIGGGIENARLRSYPIDVAFPEDGFVLMEKTIKRVFIQQGGLLSDEPDRAPDHHASYTSSKQRYELSPGNDQLIVSMHWNDGAGINVRREMTFKRDSYLIELRYFVTNDSQTTWSGRLYDQLQRTNENGREGFVYTYTGAALSTPEHLFEKFDYDDFVDEAINQDVNNGWIGVLQHYFVAALLPPAEISAHYYSRVIDDRRYIVGYYGQSQTVPPGGSAVFESAIYVGPKLQHVLRAIAPGLDRSVDYGILWFIAEPLFGALEWLQNLTGNWGFAIILVTFCLKLVFYPLSAAGYRSMANMRRVQPRMVSIKERYAKDRTQMNQAMMKLYKEEKINPLGGCFPIIVQIPVFISLYWVLLESVELRQAPFIFWWQDLSSADPYYVLPLMMGISMWIQQKLNPAPMDPTQAKVMQLLPFVFTVFFAFFPSGLVLYWVVNNILSIAQQWLITKRIEENAANA